MASTLIDSKPAASFAKNPPKSLWQQIKKNWFVYAFLLPSFILFITWIYYPAGVAFFESMFNWQPNVRNEFVGYLNFKSVLTDRGFWISWRNTLLIAAWTFTIPFAMPILVAEAIFNLKSKVAKNFYRIAVLVPVLVPGIVNLMIWKWMYVYPDGGINLILKTAGLGQYVTPWLATQNTAMPAILFMGFPWITGVASLVYLAGLLGIELDVIDASKIDGCSTWRRIISIDLPYLMGQIRLYLIFGIIGLLQGFGAQLALTRGGPNNATIVPGLYLYKLAFGLERFEKAHRQMGEASAVGVILFVLILGLSIMVYRRTGGSKSDQR